MSESEKPPSWFDKSKLRRAYYAEGYTGWVIDLGDGTCRYANTPLLGEDGPQWGDRVPLIENSKNVFPMADSTHVIERRP